MNIHRLFSFPLFIYFPNCTKMICYFAQLFFLFCPIDSVVFSLFLSTLQSKIVLSLFLFLTDVNISTDISILIWLIIVIISINVFWCFYTMCTPFRPHPHPQDEYFSFRCLQTKRKHLMIFYSRTISIAIRMPNSSSPSQCNTSHSRNFVCSLVQRYVAVSNDWYSLGTDHLSSQKVKISELMAQVPNQLFHCRNRDGVVLQIMWSTTDEHVILYIEVIRTCTGPNIFIFFSLRKKSHANELLKWASGSMPMKGETRTSSFSHSFFFSPIEPFEIGHHW